MDKTQPDVYSLIEYALTLRDSGLSETRLIRTCLFISVLLAVDCNISESKLLEILQKVYGQTMLAMCDLRVMKNAIEE